MRAKIGVLHAPGQVFSTCHLCCSRGLHSAGSGQRTRFLFLRESIMPVRSCRVAERLCDKGENMPIRFVSFVGLCSVLFALSACAPGFPKNGVPSTFDGKWAGVLETDSRPCRSDQNYRRRRDPVWLPHWRGVREGHKEVRHLGTDRSRQPPRRRHRRCRHNRRGGRHPFRRRTGRKERGKAPVARERSPFPGNRRAPPRRRSPAAAGSAP